MIAYDEAGSGAARLGVARLPRRQGAEERSGTLPRAKAFGTKRVVLARLVSCTLANAN
jgi:hypothetical protein